jgi:RimJ/RimL family protein N-acetyltransferase
MRTACELGIELKETGQIIGVMSLMHIDPASKNAEAGYWLGKKYWGQGIAKEALKLILEFGFKKLELVRIYARVTHPNIASARLLERCGFKYEGRMRKSTFTNGKWMDDLMYAILKEEYKR